MTVRGLLQASTIELITWDGTSIAHFVQLAFVRLKSEGFLRRIMFGAITSTGALYQVLSIAFGTRSSQDRQRSTKVVLFSTIQMLWAAVKSVIAFRYKYRYHYYVVEAQVLQETGTRTQIPGTDIPVPTHSDRLCVQRSHLGMEYNDITALGNAQRRHVYSLLCLADQCRFLSGTNGSQR